MAARAGHSEHQTGLALDIFSKTDTTTSNFKNSLAAAERGVDCKYGSRERFALEKICLHS